jgi:hypothetical protein
MVFAEANPARADLEAAHRVVLPPVADLEVLTGSSSGDRRLPGYDKFGLPARYGFEE